jgi:hypothetical protein
MPPYPLPAQETSIISLLPTHIACVDGFINDVDPVVLTLADEQQGLRELIFTRDKHANYADYTDSVGQSGSAEPFHRLKIVVLVQLTLL